jgi:hypothetical protein
MKFIHTLAFLLLIGNIICNCGTYSDPSVDNCKKANSGEGYCCYYETPKDTSDPKGCSSFSK